MNALKSCKESSQFQALSIEEWSYLATWRHAEILDQVRRRVCMICGTIAFHRDAQPSSKSRLNRAPSTSIPREASYEMTWQQTCTSILKYQSSLFLLCTKKKKQTHIEKVIVAPGPGWTQTHFSKLHMQDQNHNKHRMANKTSFMVSS